MSREQTGDKYVWNLVCQGRQAEKEGLPLAGCYAAAIFQLRDEAGLQELEQRLKGLSREHGSSCSQPVPWKNGFLLVLAGTSAQQESFWQRWDLCAGSEKVGVGIGRNGHLSRLWRSFEEARIAGCFQTTNDREGFVQKFTGLGVFSSIFRQSWQEVEAFAREELRTLQEYDRTYNAHLLPTLKVLLRHDFSWKASAEELFVHVNTLRYRYEKIKEVLDWERDSMDTRATIYAAIRTAEVLEALEAPVFAEAWEGEAACACE